MHFMKAWWFIYAPVDWVIIGSGNGLLHLFSTSSDCLPTEPPEKKNFCEISAKTIFQNNTYKNVVWKMLAIFFSPK